MITRKMMKTWPYYTLIDFKGYRFSEIALKLLIWPFAVFFFGLSLTALGLSILMNGVLRSWVVYPKALNDVTQSVWQPRSFSLFGWVGKLLSFVLLFFYGALIMIERFLRMFTLGILKFLDLKES